MELQQDPKPQHQRQPWAQALHSRAVAGEAQRGSRAHDHRSKGPAVEGWWPELVARYPAGAGCSKQRHTLHSLG